MPDSQAAPSARLVSELLREDPDLRDLVEEFVGGLSQRLAEFKQAFEELDWDRLRALAHRLKGASGSYGYPDVSRLAMRMEANFKVHRGDEFDEPGQPVESTSEAEI